MCKKIVVFSDGTGQEGGKKHNTNVYKLFNMIEDRTSKQVSFYDRGLGTGVRKLTGNAFGMGISKNIRECYQFIFENYEAGDEIFLFGFSRGATTVRSLSGFIHLFGILPKSRPELIKKAYKIYKMRNSDKRKARADAFIAKHHSMWCKIKFLGVWDTVAALGIPIKAIDVVVDKVKQFQHHYHNLELSESVEHGRHALAIDDERLTFHPKLWDQKISNDQTMKQVWFCGMHTDVGGGYPEQQLSDIALEWMMEEAEAYGLRVYPRNKIVLDLNPDGVMHNSRGGFFTRLYRRKPRSWPYDERSDLPIVHASVLQRTLDPLNNPGSTYAPWIRQKPFEKEGKPSAVNTTRYATIVAKRRWNRTPFVLEQGKSYTFEASGKWFDKTIPADATGFPPEKMARFVPFRRFKDSHANWFSVIGCCDKKKGTMFDIGELVSTQSVYKAEETGVLYCFANDIWTMYFNNTGAIRLVVKEIQENSEDAVAE